MGRDIPSLVYGTQTDYKKLYFSESEAALKIGITLQAGYGKIEQGQTLAKNASAAGGVGKVYVSSALPATLVPNEFCVYTL